MPSPNVAYIKKKGVDFRLKEQKKNKGVKRGQSGHLSSSALLVIINGCVRLMA